MDITVKINLLLVILVGAICGFLVKGNLKKNHDAPPAAEYSYISVQNSSNLKPDDGSALINKILSLKTAPDKGDGGAQTSVVSSGTAASQPSPIIAENRLYQPPQGQSSFTKEDRGQWMALPSGFSKATTNSYVVYREGEEVSKDLQKYLDDIHGNFVLDVIPFSVFSKFGRIFVMLFRSKDKYSSITSMPQWSNAMTDLNANAVYIMEDKSFKGNFVHELSHIYYDGFFKPTLSPLWMSEGFAVKMQSAAQTAQENGWLDREKAMFKNGRYITFAEFLDAQNLSKYGSEDALTWYAQAYSVIDYLLKNKTRDEFYQFSKNIKDGMPVSKALYRAYGMPFNTERALEYAWQADLQKDFQQ